MKTKSLMTIAIIILLSGSILAQKQMKQNGQRGEKMMNIPDLTEVQKTKLKEMKTSMMKEMLPLKNEMREKQAHLKTISTGDNVKMAEVNKTIEEISAVKLIMAKKRAQHKQDVRKILTDDQRVYFDMNSGRHKKMHKKRMPGKMQRNCMK